MDPRLSRSPSPVVGKGGKPISYSQHGSLSRSSSRASSKASSRPSSRGSPYGQGGSLLLSALHQSPPQPQHFNQLVPPLPSAVHRISPLNQHRISPLPPLSAYHQPAIPMFQGPGLVNILPTQPGGLPGTISPEIVAGISPSSQNTINPLSMLRPPGPLQLGDLHPFNTLRHHLPTISDQGAAALHLGNEQYIKSEPRDRYPALLQRELEKAHLKSEENRICGTGTGGNSVTNQTLEQLLKASTPAEINNVLRSLAIVHSSNLQEQHQRHLVSPESAKQTIDGINRTFSSAPLQAHLVSNKPDVYFQEPEPPAIARNLGLPKSIINQQPHSRTLSGKSVVISTKADHPLPLTVRTNSDISTQSQLVAHLMGKPSSVSSSSLPGKLSPYSHIPNSEISVSGNRATSISQVSQSSTSGVGSNNRLSPYNKLPQQSMDNGNHRMSPYHSRSSPQSQAGTSHRTSPYPGVSTTGYNSNRSSPYGQGQSTVIHYPTSQQSVGKGMRDISGHHSIGKGLREQDGHCSSGKGMREHDGKPIGKGVRDSTIGRGIQGYDSHHSIGKGTRETDNSHSIGKGIRENEEHKFSGKGIQDNHHSIGKGIRETSSSQSIGKGIREYGGNSNEKRFATHPSVGKGIRVSDTVNRGVRGDESGFQTIGKVLRDPLNNNPGQSTHNASSCYNQGSSVNLSVNSNSYKNAAVTVTTHVHTHAIQSVPSLSNFASEPVLSIGKPTSISGKPTAAFGKPAAMLGKPTAVSERPKSMSGKPAYLYGRQSCLTGKPASVQVHQSAVSSVNVSDRQSAVTAATTATISHSDSSSTSFSRPPFPPNVNLSNKGLLQIASKPATMLLQSKPKEQTFTFQNTSQMECVGNSLGPVKMEVNNAASSSVSSHIYSTADHKDNIKGDDKDKKFDVEMIERQANLLNMRVSTLENMPPSQTSYRVTYRSQTMALHRAKAGSIFIPAKSLDLLRQNLQKFLNTELDGVIQKYMDEYFKPALKNIQSNSGLGTVSDDTLLTLCSQILEEAKKMYTVETRSVTPDDNVSESGSISSKTTLQENKDIRANKHSLFNIKKRRGSSDSDASAKRRIKKPKNWSGISGRSTPSKKPGTDPVKKGGPKWDSTRLTTDTLFVMGSKANKALGLGNMRGRLYVKHPDLYKYIGDQEDKTWLFENRKMPSTGGKAYLLILEDVKDLADTDEYKNSNGVSLDDMISFSVPQWMVDKMKTQMNAQRNDKGSKPTKGKAGTLSLVNSNQVEDLEDRIPFTNMYSSDKLLIDSKSEIMQDSPATTDNLELLCLDQDEDLDTPAMSPFTMTGGFAHDSPVPSDSDKGEEPVSAPFDLQ